MEVAIFFFHQFTSGRACSLIFSIGAEIFEIYPVAGPTFFPKAEIYKMKDSDARHLSFCKTTQQAKQNKVKETKKTVFYDPRVKLILVF